MSFLSKLEDRVLPKFVLLALMSLTFILSACGQNERAIWAPSSSDLLGIAQPSISLPAPKSAQILIADSFGGPIANAKVMIGPKVNVPFSDNIFTADKNGIIPLPASWTDEQPITVEAPGFVRATWLSQKPQPLSLQLRAAIQDQRLELKGTATGFTNLKKDGWVDVGIVFPALRKDQLASLQVTDLVSPDVDVISILGQKVNIPSNISIPKQDERYYFTITLDKPVFRSYFPEARTWKLVSAHARFPFEKVVDDIRDGKSFFEVLNYFEFKSAGLNDIAISGASTKKDLSIKDIIFDSTISVTAPRFAKGQTVLIISTTEDHGLLYPTDVKTFNSGETRNLVTSNGSTGYIVSALRATDAPSYGAASEVMSVALMPQSEITQFDFLNIVKSPKITGNSISLTPPSMGTPSAPTISLATFASLSYVNTVSVGETKIDKKSPLWDVYATNWNTSIDLPELPSLVKKGSSRWEVLFGETDGKIQMSPSIAESFNRLSKTAVDL